MRYAQEVYKDPIFSALNPIGKQFMRTRFLSGNLNPFASLIHVAALLSFGEFQHIKMVAAFQMMLEDYRAGLYEGMHTIVVDSSGNTAHAVARLAPAFGFENVKVVLSADVPASKTGILAALSSVEIIKVGGGKSVSARAQEEGQRLGHVHIDQYKHLGNSRAHELFTGPEIDRVLGGNVGIIAIAMGSSGTAAGVAKYFHEKYPATMILGVRPVLGEQVPGARDKAKMEKEVTIPWEPLVDEVIEVSRKQAFITTRLLGKEVEPQVGPTSGLACAGLFRYMESLDSGDFEALSGKTAAFICADSAMLYSDVMMAELDTGQGM